MECGLWDKVYKETVVKTARPDQPEITKLALIRATRSLHGMAKWVEDVGIFTLAYGGLNPSADLREVTQGRFRQLLGVKVDGQLLRQIEVEDVFSKPAIGGQFGYTFFHKRLQIRYPTAPKKVAVRVLLHPLVDENNYESWIAERYPYIVSDMTARDVLGELGFNQNASFYASLMGSLVPAQGHLGRLLNDNPTLE